METIQSVVRKRGFWGIAGGFAAGGFLSSVPVIGLVPAVAIAGYQYEHLNDVVASDDPELGGYDGFGKYAMTGLKASFAQFLLMFPLIVVLVAAVSAAVLLFENGESFIEGQSAGAMAAALVAILAMAVWGAFVNILTLNGIVRGGMSDYLDFKEGFSVRYASAKPEYWAGFWASFGYSLLGVVAVLVVSSPLIVLSSSLSDGIASWGVSAVQQAISVAIMLPFYLVGISRYAPYVRKAYGSQVPPVPPVDQAVPAPPVPPMPPAFQDSAATAAEADWEPAPPQA